MNIARYVLLLFLSTELLSAAAPRVAILSDAENAALADQLTPALSAQKEIELVERSEIEKVLSEQKLSGIGLQESLTLGKLLRADGLLVLEVARVKEKSSVTARLIATAPGVAVASAVFASDASETATAVASRFQPLWQKLAVSRKDAVPISLLNLRFPIRGSETLETQLTFMLSHQLVQRREVFVLERWRMDDLVLEKTLTQPAEDFWTGSYVVDGEIEPLAGDKLKVTVHVRPPGANTHEKLEAFGTQAELSKLANELATGVIQKLPRTTALGEWSAASESKQYLNEARWAFNTQLFPEARSAAEASWALGCRDPALSILRVRIHSALAFPQIEVDSDYETRGFRQSEINPDSMSGRLNSALAALTLANELIPDGATKVKPEIMSCCTSAVLSGSRILRIKLQLGGPTNDDIEELRDVLRTVAERLFPLETPDDAEDKRLFYITMGMYLPYWYDQPREAVKAWRRLLGKRFVDDHWQGVTFSGVREQLLDRRLSNRWGECENLPWLIAWHGESKSELDAIWVQFVKTLETSADVSETIDGSLLRFAETNPAAVRPQRRTPSSEEIRLCERMWEGRDYLLTHDLVHGYFKALLHPPVTSYMDQEYMRRWLDYYLPNTKGYQWYLNFLLWQGAKLDRDSAEKIYPLLKEYRARLPKAQEDADKREKELLERFPGLNGTPAPSLPPVKDDSLVVTQSWFPPELIEGKKGERTLRHGLIGTPRAGTPALTPDHLWIPISFDNRARKPGSGDGIEIVTNQRIYKLDRRTFRVLEVLDPPIAPENVLRPGDDDRQVGSGEIRVSDSSLIIELKKGFQHLNLKSQQWRVLPLPEKSYSSALLVGDDLFAGFSHPSNQGESGIIHYTAATGQYQVLASNRSQPAVGPLTDDKDTVESLFEVGPGQLGAVIWRGTKHTAFVYDQRLGKWEPLLPNGAELAVWYDKHTAVLQSEKCGIAIAQPGKPILPLFGSSFSRTGKLPSPPQVLAKSDLPKRWLSEQMVYGDKKIWIARYDDHPTLGMRTVIKTYTTDGKHRELFLRFQLSPEALAVSNPIQRVPTPVKLNEACVRIEWMNASEAGLTFFTGDAGDRAFPNGVWFLPMNTINEWFSKQSQQR